MSDRFGHLSPGRRSGALPVVAACLLVLVGIRVSAAQQDQPIFTHPVLIDFQGEITPAMLQYFDRRLEKAKQAGADLVIVQIDSPGGYVDASFSIAHHLRDVDWATTVAYVPREAISGAAFVALGCDEIVMHPSAKMGDAGAIFLDEDFMFRYVPEKARSYVVAQVRELARAKGRPPALAESMAHLETVVWRVRDSTDGSETFLSEAEIAADENPDQWEKVQQVLESAEGSFLVVDGVRGVELTLTQATVEDRSALLARHGVTEEQLTKYQYEGTDTAVYLLNLTAITWLLFAVGLIGLYCEVCMPGTVVGGLIAIVCFSLFFWSRLLGGTAEMLDVVLFMAGLICIAFEVLVIPGFGLAGLTGVLLVFVSLLMAGQGFLVPTNAEQFDDFLTNAGVLALSVVTFGVSAMILNRYMGSVPVLNRFILGSSGPKSPGSDSEIEASGTSLVVGATGTSVTRLRPAGKARFDDQLTDVVTDGDFVEPSQPVKIVEIRGNRVLVVRDGRPG